MFFSMVLMIIRALDYVSLGLENTDKHTLLSLLIKLSSIKRDTDISFLLLRVIPVGHEGGKEGAETSTKI